MKVNVKNVELTDEECEEILGTALEGGIGYWSGADELVGTDHGYASVKLYSLEEDWDGALEVNRDTIRLGVDILFGVKKPEDALYTDLKGVDAVGHPMVTAQVLDEDIDADGADLIVQLALFGCGVFG